MNERDAIAERERVALQARVRDQERDARPFPTVKIYEITMKNADEPGLPAPKSYIATNTVTTGVQTNWTPNIAFYSLTNSITGEFTNYFGPVTNSADESALVLPTNQVVKITVSKAVPQDPTLEESANILRDYISLLSKSGMLTAYH